MLSDQFYDLIGLVGLQKLLRDASLWQLITTTLALVLVGVVIDYARMLWLRAKMVGEHCTHASPQLSKTKGFP